MTFWNCRPFSINKLFGLFCSSVDHICSTKTINGLYFCQNSPVRLFWPAREFIFATTSPLYIYFISCDFLIHSYLPPRKIYLLACTIIRYLREGWKFFTTDKSKHTYKNILFERNRLTGLHIFFSKWSKLLTSINQRVDQKGSQELTFKHYTQFQKYTSFREKPKPPNKEHNLWKPLLQ